MFEELAKIETRKEMKVLKSDLEKVLNIEEKIIKKYENDERFKLYSGKHFEAYQSLYTTVQEKFSNREITPSLLQGYIDARDNTEKDTRAIIRGMYSAALLEIISTKKPETHTFIDGKGKTFNYLFYHIHNVKNLTLINIIGHNTLANAGLNGGNVENITLSEIRGDYTLYNAGMNGGNVENITLHKITGDCTLSFAGRGKGSAKHITLQDIKGNNTLSYAGWNGGSAQNITLRDITGHDTLHSADWNNGNLKNILQENQLTEKQKQILSQIELIAQTMYLLSFEEQTRAHDKIARLQKEIFAGEK